MSIFMSVSLLHDFEPSRLYFDNLLKLLDSYCISMSCMTSPGQDPFPCRIFFNCHCLI